MQYVTGYILDNQIDVLLHTDGLERRFEKVYERSIKLYKEFDNVFTIVVKNQDQKKQFVNGTECELQISDKNNDLVKTYVERIYDQIEGLDSTLKKNIKSLEGVTDDTRKLRKKLREGNNSLVELAKKVIDLIIGTPKKKMDD